MKTAEEIMKEKFIGVYAFESQHNLPAIRKLIKYCMQEYASQAIDRCAEVAETKYEEIYNENGSVYGGGDIVDSQSILNVKQELK